MTLDPARRDLAVLAILRARRRIDMLRGVIGRRVAFDVGARHLGAMLSVVSPLLEAVEALIPEAKP